MSNGMEIVLPTVRQHEAILLPRVTELDKWSGGGEAAGEALIRYTMAELSVNDDLRSCTPTSIYLALLSCAVTRLVPGKLKGYSFLVPFGNMRKGPDGKETKVQEATFMMGWKGVKHIGFRTGLHLVSAVIHENDVFSYDVGTSKRVSYSKALKASGPEIGAAAWVELPRSGLEVEYLTMAELDKIKAAATRIRKSPAWDGPFSDQMRRKSALKRLGKQIEMGEEFLKADMIEIAQDDQDGDGSPRRALDELTDGAASKFLGQQSTEAAAFGHLPRPTQVQVPADAKPAEVKPDPKPEAKPEGKLAAATDKARAADKNRSKPPASSGQPSASPAAPAATSPTKTATGEPPPTNPTPATSTDTSAKSSTPASASPAASSPASSTPSTGTPSESSASGDQTPQQSDESDPPNDFGGDASDGDTSFDTTFFEESDDPVDRAPQTHDEWVVAFKTWAEAHTTKESAVADWPQFQQIYSGWLACCVSKGQMETEKLVFTTWSRPLFSTGRKADPRRNIEAQPADPQIIEMQDGFSRRHKEVP